MALSKIIKQNCPECGKIAEEVSSIDFGDTKLITLKCGHMMSEAVVGSATGRIRNLAETKELMQFQYDGVKFAEQANVRCLIADEQGLGKTVQAIALIKQHKQELLPALIVVPSSVKLQWHHQFVDWCGHEGYLCQTISSGKEFAVPGFQIYIVSYDLLKNENILKMVKDSIQLVIVDECQRIKNHTSERSKAVQDVCRNIPHVLMLSGTPIENNAGEYFTALNILQPRRFPTYQHYLDGYCDYYFNGYGNKIGGLKNRELFHERTKDFIIRRRKADVLKNLPKFSRDFDYVELDRKLNKAYAQGLEELEEIMYSDDMDSMAKGAAKIAIMSKLRHITGLSKVPDCVERVTDFLLSTEEKIVIFTHHTDAAQMLEADLNKWLKDGAYEPVLMFHSGLSSEERYNLVQKFKEPKSRVMVASTKAAGTGLDGLQDVCCKMIMLERQWNPSTESQAEARLDRYGQKFPVSATYMIAGETIDEYFTELVEQKRAIVAGALDNRDVEWNEQSLMNDLAEMLITKGRKKWVL